MASFFTDAPFVSTTPTPIGPTSPHLVATWEKPSQETAARPELETAELPLASPVAVVAILTSRVSRPSNLPLIADLPLILTSAVGVALVLALDLPRLVSLIILRPRAALHLRIAPSQTAHQLIQQIAPHCLLAAPALAVPCIDRSNQPIFDVDALRGQIQILNIK
jgi:hypothetical protein